MHSFGFKVVPSDGEGSGVPVAIAGQVMVDVQRLITEIGAMMVRLELRIQNGVPPEILSKFDLRIGGSSSAGLGSDPAEGNEALMEDVLNRLSETLSFLGKGVVGTWMEDNFPEELGRGRIAGCILDLADHLDGHTLVFGTPDAQGTFRRVDREKLSRYTATGDASVGAFIGTVSRDPVRRNRLVVSNGSGDVQLSFGSNIDPADIPSFISAGPVIVTGTLVRNRDGSVSEIRNADGCYSFPQVRFHRIITSARDIVLLNPVEGRPSHDPSSGEWSLSCDVLGIDVTKGSWDECVTAFHDYFSFLWEMYFEGEGDFEGEELEIREYLQSLAPVL